MTTTICIASKFLSTLSLRRATLTSVVSSAGTTDFYPRSPCGERLHRTVNIQRPTAFLSTLSLRRATRECDTAKRNQDISIHALLAESDQNRRELLLRYQEFLSTLSLRRATAVPRLPMAAQPQFLSTLSLRRATIYRRSGMTDVQHNFYPRSPYGERRGWGTRCWPADRGFLSTLSLRRATAKVHKTVEHFCAYETNFMEIASSC